jgi:hypothetical protein
VHELVVIKASGEIVCSEFKKYPPLMALQKAVGGPIQEIPHLLKYEGQRIRAYAHEEGKIRKFPLNEIATRVWLACLGEGPFRYKPKLFGDVAIVRKKKEITR